MEPDLSYFDAVAGAGLTHAANRADWDALRLAPRVLRPLADCTTRCQLAGRALPHPLLLAPVALQRLAHPEGELATALAAAAQGAGLVLSCQSSVAVEQVARAYAGEADCGPLWFQLYHLGDWALTQALAQRAADAGCEALVLTVDAPLQSPRAPLPPGAQAVHLPPGFGQGSAATLLAGAPTWDDVARLVRDAPLPLWLKGVLHPADAQQAQALGVAGVIVSNHGGRALDGAVSTARALPAVRAAVGADYPLLVDGGIRSASDVLKALALGADAVLLGRPQVQALAAGGAAGVAQWLRRLQDELLIALAQAGCASPAAVSADTLWPTA
ncbi:MAG: alpha-hydroxy-acid oxidizing protein [Proteobacteria bacterium]|nr:alpha-hydroxy-acid oxidizing protein [Pseudomonadota bacterium]